MRHWRPSPLVQVSPDSRSSFVWCVSVDFGRSGPSSRLSTSPSASARWRTIPSPQRVTQREEDARHGDVRGVRVVVVSRWGHGVAPICGCCLMPPMLRPLRPRTQNSATTAPDPTQIPPSTAHPTSVVNSTADREPATWEPTMTTSATACTRGRSAVDRTPRSARTLRCTRSSSRPRPGTSPRETATVRYRRRRQSPPRPPVPHRLRRYEPPRSSRSAGTPRVPARTCRPYEVARRMR
jgi:hypothetical protein